MFGLGNDPGCGLPVGNTVCVWLRDYLLKGSLWFGDDHVCGHPVDLGVLVEVKLLQQCLVVLVWGGDPVCDQPCSWLIC